MNVFVTVVERPVMFVLHKADRPESGVQFLCLVSIIKVRIITAQENNPRSLETFARNTARKYRAMSSKNIHQQPKRLLLIHEATPWQRDNEFIRSAYRYTL